MSAGHKINFGLLPEINAIMALKYKILFFPNNNSWLK